MAKDAAVNKPVLVSEMGQFDCYCPAARGFASAGVGWLAWELMLAHDQFSRFQGLLYSNGTARSQKEVECIRQLAAEYPNVIPCPTPPPKPPGPTPDGCRDSNCVVYRDTDTAFFSYTPPSSTVKPCWHAWSADGGDGPAETGGTLHFCNVAGSFVTFTLPSNGSAADLVYKSGPDCGIMDITSTSGLTQRFRAFPLNLYWCYC